MADSPSLGLHSEASVHYAAVEARLGRLEACMLDLKAELGRVREQLSEHRGREAERDRLGRLGLMLAPIVLGLAMLFGAVVHKLGLKWGQP